MSYLYNSTLEDLFKYLELQKDIVTVRVQNFLNEFFQQVGILADKLIPILARIVILCLILWIFLVISFLSYGLFRLVYLPNATHIAPVHFEFAHTDLNNSMITVVDAPESASLSPNFPAFEVDYDDLYLWAGQGYDISVTLEVPESEKNQDIGLFMIELFLTTENEKTFQKVVQPLDDIQHPKIGKGTDDCPMITDESEEEDKTEKKKEAPKEDKIKYETVFTSRRHSMLKYRSKLVYYMQTIFFSIPYTLCMMDESQSLTVFMFENFKENTYNTPVTKARIQLSKPVQIYSAQLRFDAHFTGLKWFMYWYPTISCLVITGLFFTGQLSAVTTLYLVYLIYSSNKIVKENHDFDDLNADVIDDVKRPQRFQQQNEEFFSTSPSPSPSSRAAVENLRFRGGQTESE